MTTGEKIKARRLDLDMTAEDLGNKVGLTKSAIGRFETGKIEKMDYRIFLKIAIALDAKPSDLISEEDIRLITGGDESDKIVELFDSMDAVLRERMKDATPRQIERIQAYAQGVLESGKE